MTFTPERSYSHPVKTTIGIQTEKLPVDLTYLNILILMLVVNLFLCDCDLVFFSLLPCHYCVTQFMCAYLVLGLSLVYG